VERVLDDLASIAKQVRLAFRWRPKLSDANDDMVLETAVNGNAGAIVTFNQRDFVEARRQFDCAVILPIEALERTRRSNP
jgi:predicted nucleic acid-binding protein